MTAVSRSYAWVEGGQIHYRVAGNTDRMPLVLLHQTPSTSAMYLPLMAELASDFYLLAPDTPGFGNSDRLPGECTIAGFSRQLLAFLQALKIERCLLFGHHTGAAIAVQMASDEPQRFAALALSGPTLLSERQRQTLPDTASPYARDDSGTHLQEMWQRIRAKDTNAPAALIERETLSAIECGDYYQASYRAVCAQDYQAQLQKLSCPVLAFAGDNDSLAAAVTPTLELLRDGHTVNLPPGAGTYACESHAPALAELLREFFNRVPINED